MKKSILTFLGLMLFFVGANAQFSVQKGLLEEFSGAWCGYCADGAYLMEQTLASHQNAIGVTLHNGDAMALPEEGTLASFYITGYPSGVINRSSLGLSRNTWNSNMGTTVQGAGSVTVSFDSVNFDQATRQITAVVNHQFTNNLSGDLRVNMYVVEDNVTGSGAGYNQANYDNGTPGHPYQGAGNPIIGFNHRHVVRAFLGGAWGISGIIPATVSFGSSYSHTYTYTLPAGYDESEVSLVAYVSRYDGSGPSDREILNSEEVPLMTATYLEDGLNTENQFMEIYPNPASEKATIAFSMAKTGEMSMEVLNVMGQPVASLASGIMGEGAHTLYWNGRNSAGVQVPNGIYLVRLRTENGQSLTKRMQLVR